MAAKLTKIRLTSVDLVRAGANQQADICLFKSKKVEYPQLKPRFDRIHTVQTRFDIIQEVSRKEGLLYDD